VSLTGNLEDLPLLDIIQIVSFSKKTGSLAINNPGGAGAILFRDGAVVAAFSPETGPLEPAVKTAPPPRRATLLRRRIERALEQLIRLREGQFSFSLAEDPPKVVSGRDLTDEFLVDGINAQELLIDLARGMDEDRRDSAAAIESSFAEPGDEAVVPGPRDPASFADLSEPEVIEVEEEFEETFDEVPPARTWEEGGGASLAALVDEPDATIPIPPIAAPPPPAAAAPPPAPAAPAKAAESPAEVSEAAGSARTVLLVDDEADVREILAGHLRGAGWDVVDAEDPDEAVKKASRLGRAGTPYLLVVDLGMPTSGGSSFQGGFEVVKRLWKMNQRPPVLMMTDSLSPSLQARARQMAVQSFVFKPGLSKLDPAQFESDMKAFAGKVATLLPRILQGAVEGPRTAPQVAEAKPRRAEVVAEIPAGDQLWAVLREKLDELRQTSDVSQISQLVMRVSREFFERGALFLIKNEQMRGLGGFGPSPKDMGFNLLVREITVPLSEPSVFLDVVASGRPFYGALPEGPWNRHVIGKLGSFKSTGVALMPLIANRETIALLFGDNPETGRPIAKLEPLELFMTQAGISLENAFLQKKLQTMGAGG
jgi:CheY-like chemotaxis protein